MSSIGSQIPNSSAVLRWLTDFAMPFNPVVDDDGKVIVGEGWVRVGRQLYIVPASNTTLKDGENVYLKVEHARSPTELPTFTVVVKGSDEAAEKTEDQLKNTSTTTYVPLYYFGENGIEKDYRVCPTIPLYE